MPGDDRSVLHVIKDLHLTVQNIVAGIAIISRYHGDDKSLVWEIKNRGCQPTVTISYKLGDSIVKKGLEDDDSVDSTEGCGEIVEIKGGGVTPSVISKDEVIQSSSVIEGNVILEDKENGEKNAVENIICIPALITEVDDKVSESSTSHQRNPNHGNSFLCSYCEKYFLSLEDRIKHEKTHTREKPYPCSYCEKTFARVSHKKSHELTHTGEKPFPCSFCDKSFAQVHDKTRHERIHTGEKPYSCSYCQKPFARVSHKKAHERIHTGEKPYSCRYCDRCFAQLSHKKAHEESHEKKNKKKIVKYSTIKLYINKPDSEKDNVKT